jgi:hypothetical protein
MAALADGRLAPSKALASLGLPTRIDDKVMKMDFFAVRKESDEEEVLAAFRRQGLRPANEAEYDAFLLQHRDVVHEVVVRSRHTLVLMGERVRIACHRPRESVWGYRVLYRSRDGHVIRDSECADTRWDKTYRFLGVRLDRRPRVSAIPTVSLRHASPKVRPTA